MLLVERYRGQQIQIGENINIVIIGFDGGKVKVGIDAPKNLKIRWDKKTDLNKPVAEEKMDENRWNR